MKLIKAMQIKFRLVLCSFSKKIIIFKLYLFLKPNRLDESALKYLKFAKTILHTISY